MYKILEVVYKDGKLILDEKLDEKEGKKLKIIIINEEDKENIELAKKSFFDFVESHSFNLPDDYKFDREEIHNI